MMMPVDIKNIMLISRHICITESLPDIGKTIPLALFDFSYPFLYCCRSVNPSRNFGNRRKKCNFTVTTSD